MTKKQTSTDFLWDLIPPETQNYIIKQFDGYEKAKEMEKEQILDAYNVGWYAGVNEKDCWSLSHYYETYTNEND